jgi:tetratricopeptide (TPR) repeat protein
MNQLPDVAAALPDDTLRTARALRLVGAWILVFIALLILYGPALNGGYLWDDNDNVTKPMLRSWLGLERIWFHWGATQTYYPVLHTVYWLEYQMWGYATLGYHVASILFHSISVCLVYFIVRRLRIPGAVLAAAIFAVHPVYVESVAWITEQKNTLSGMFSLAAILTYLHFDDDRRRGSYALACILFLLALASKATAVTLPLALAVILWWKRGRLSWRRDCAPLAAWFALSLLVGVFTVWYERVYVGVEGSEFSLTLTQRCLVASRAVCFYFGKLFWPTNLTLLYPHWEINSAEAWQYLYAEGLLLLLIAAWAAHRRSRGPLAALLFFLAMVFPLLGFFNTYIFRYTYVCDHFQYLPSLGIVVLVSAVVALGLKRLPAAGRYIGGGLCVLLIGTLAFASWQQCAIYSDAVTFYQTMIDRNPTCWMAYNNLGLLMAGTGRTSDAIEHYQKALSLNPDYPEALNNLGHELANQGRLDEAIEMYRHALRIKSNFPLALDNLGNALLAAGHPDEAKQQYEIALGINPDLVVANYNLGNSLLNSGHLDEAIEHYRHALQFGPDYTDAHYNLGIALGKSGKTEEAIEEFQETLRQKPDFVGAHNNLGNALLDAGRFEEAIQEFRQAIRLNPQDLQIYLNLAKTYDALHRTADVIDITQQALNMARSQGNEALAKQIEGFLKKYRSDHSSTPQPAPTSPSVPAAP